MECGRAARMPYPCYENSISTLLCRRLASAACRLTSRIAADEVPASDLDQVGTEFGHGEFPLPCDGDAHPCQPGQSRVCFACPKRCRQQIAVVTYRTTEHAAVADAAICDKIVL
jgi:hypothetical protein